MTAISANDQGNSPTSAPVIAVPSDQPIAGGIKSANFRGKIAKIQVTCSLPNGSPTKTERVICTPKGAGVTRSAPISNNSAVVRKMTKSRYDCVVRIVTDAGSADSTPKTIRRAR